MAVQTGALLVTLVDIGGDAPPYWCRTDGKGRNSTDAIAPTRSPTFPDGVSTASEAACCAACASDSACTAWVYSGGSGLNCWPLARLGGIKSGVPGRTLGGNGPNGSNLPRGMSLSISFDSPGSSGNTTMWTPATGSDPENLNGTYTALDCYSTPMQCNDEYAGKMRPGLLSRTGWATLDDSIAGRVVPVPERPAGIPTWWDTSIENPTAVDLYFNGRPDGSHRAALADWVRVLGKPAMLPRSAFGVWWSRYYPYSQTSIVEEVLRGYRNYSIPLNNLVLDMDWHQEPTDKTCQSWGNYDVNTKLFPDMTGFAERMHADGMVVGNPLKLSFNVHPQTGVDHCDSRYATIAAAMGVNPATNATVACDFGNATYADTLFSVYFDALPLHLVDVWWTDYGGCGGPNPQLWSNRIFYQHQKYGRKTRGQAFSRYGGTGNHRSPHGFSGDTFQHEVALHWQVATTQTAANVLWGYWSHDIGGFHTGNGAPGDADPTNTTGAELLLRWIQFGAVSPILRTHCDHCERRVWLFPYFLEMRDALRLRNALGPYVYTEARTFYDTGVAPVHPLYYDYPDVVLYEPPIVQAQYAFGGSIIAAPITRMAAVPNGTLGTPVVWPVYLPDGGTWANWNGTAVHRGPVTVSVSYGPADIPLFVLAGSVIPLKTMANVAGNFPDPLVWALWPGAPRGAYSLYEDAGDSDAYQGGEFVRTNTTALGDPAAASTLTFTVAASAVAGALPDGFPAARGHVLQVNAMTAHRWKSILSILALAALCGWGMVPLPSLQASAPRVFVSLQPATAVLAAVDARSLAAMVAAHTYACIGLSQVRGVGARTVAVIRLDGAPIPPAPCGVMPGWCVVAGNHTLAEPEGALVVSAGASLSSWTDKVIVVTWAR